MALVSTCLVTLIGIHRDKRSFPKVGHIDGISITTIKDNISTTSPQTADEYAQSNFTTLTNSSREI